MSSSGTLANDPQPETETAHSHDHSDDPGHVHGDGHDHHHGPALNPECTRELVLDVPAEEVAKAYRQTTRTYQKLARIPGFRPGKVPDSVIRRKFSADIRKEVIDKLLPERFNQAVRDLGVVPVGQPQVTELTIDEDAPLHVKAVFEYIPAFSIEGYKDVVVPKAPVAVTEDEVKHELEHLRQSRATIEPVEEDRALADGDWAQISYRGTMAGDGAEAAGGEAVGPEAISDQDTLVEIGGKDTVEAFNAALRGVKPGQEIKAEVIYPADYSEAKLAGKTVSYEIDVKAIKKRTVPDLDDEFAKELGEYENLAQLDTRVREHMAARKRRAVQNETKDQLMAALSEHFQFPIPESLVQERIDARLDRGLRALASQGMEPEQMRKLDFERIRAAQRDGAIAEVKAGLLLDRIAHEENISVSDEELDQELQMAAIQTRENVDALRARLTQDDGLNRLRGQISREKTANLLYERLPG